MVSGVQGAVGARPMRWDVGWGMGGHVTDEMYGVDSRHGD